MGGGGVRYYQFPSSEVGVGTSGSRSVWGRYGWGGGGG